MKVEKRLEVEKKLEAIKPYLSEKQEKKLLKKRTEKAFGKTVYLLGKDKEGYTVWLEEPTWDCGWYWGFGYVERYTNKLNPQNARDINSHTHWDGDIVGQKEDYDFNKKTWVKTKYSHHLNENPDFVSTVLTDKESWELAELMESCYTLKKSAELFGRGGSHKTTLEAEIAICKKPEYSKEINEVILPKLFKEIKKILSPE